MEYQYQYHSFKRSITTCLGGYRYRYRTRTYCEIYDIFRIFSPS